MGTIETMVFETKTQMVTAQRCSASQPMAAVLLVTQRAQRAGASLSRSPTWVANTCKQVCERRRMSPFMHNNSNVLCRLHYRRPLTPIWQRVGPSTIRADTCEGPTLYL